MDGILWPHEDYLRVYREAGLEVVRVERPLARGDEGIGVIDPRKAGAPGWA